jgi:diguanylate cyclase (GGDEF)-like protein
MNPLTGLPGNLIIEHEIRRLVAPGHGLFAVLYADFNHFKAYNDVYGFPAGDEAIRLLARVLTAAVPTALTPLLSASSATSTARPPSSTTRPTAAAAT